MPKFNVFGKVVGSKFLGTFEAATAEDAIKKAMEGNWFVSFCHQCSEQCEDSEIVEANSELAE